jgi:uncharacterized protein
MLMQFTLENFRSFREPGTLSLVAAPLRKGKTTQSVDTNNVITHIGSFDLLKSAVLYGANASGKSNVLAGLGFMQNMVLASTVASNLVSAGRPVYFQLGEGYDQHPTWFEVVLLLEGTRYRYGFSFQGRQIVEEWLYHTPGSRETQLFERNGSTYTISSKFREGKKFKDRVRQDSLLLSTCAQWNGDISTLITTWFREKLIVTPHSFGRFLINLDSYFQSENNKPEFISYLKTFDIHIEDIDISQKKGRFVYEGNINEKLEKSDAFKALNQKVTTRRRKYDAAGHQIGIEDFDLDFDESRGTQQLFGLLPIIFTILKSGGVLVVDELESSLHPLLAQRIVKLFHENTESQAQLIFTTHDTNLLDSNIFRRDQVWFTEKDQRQGSTLYSLHDYKVGTGRERDDMAYEKRYLIGKYGAIPHLGTFKFKQP